MGQRGGEYRLRPVVALRRRSEKDQSVRRRWRKREYLNHLSNQTHPQHTVCNTTAEMTSHLIVLSSEQETKHLLIPVSRCLDLLLFSVFKDRRLKNV